MKVKVVLAIILTVLAMKALAEDNYSLKTKITDLIVYPQPAVPDSVQYTELLVYIPENMEVVPSCAAHPNRFVIDSNNPMFPYVYGVLLQAKKDNATIVINYWDKCESSRTHLAPLLRSVRLK